MFTDSSSSIKKLLKQVIQLSQSRQQCSELSNRPSWNPSSISNVETWDEQKKVFSFFTWLFSFVFLLAHPTWDEEGRDEENFPTSFSELLHCSFVWLSVWNEMSRQKSMNVKVQFLSSYGNLQMSPTYFPSFHFILFSLSCWEFFSFVQFPSSSNKFKLFPPLQSLSPPDLTRRRCCFSPFFPFIPGSSN